MRTFSRIAPLLIPAFFALHLQAEDVTYQADVQLCLPQGDLKTAVGDRLGYDFGANALYTLQTGQFLRPRVDLTFYPAFKLLGFQSGGTALNIGADYLQYLKGNLSTVYIFGGAGFVSWFPQGSDETTKLSLSLGAGIKADDQWSYELRFSQFSMGSGQKARNLAIGLNYRF